MGQLMLIEGRIIPVSEWKPDIGSDAFRYGAGFYESVRLSGGRIYFWEEHYERLARGASYWQVSLPDRQELLEDLFRLAEATGEPSGKLRIQCSVDTDRDTPLITAVLEPTGPGYRLNEQGWKAGIYREHFKPFSRDSLFKSNRRDLYLLATRWKNGLGFDEALVINPAGKIADGTFTNLFWLEGGIWHTPPVHSGGLPGIMRNFLAGLIRDSGAEVLESEAFPERVMNAEEVFLTNAIRGVRWVGALHDGVKRSDPGNQNTQSVSRLLEDWETGQ